MGLFNNKFLRKKEHQNYIDDTQNYVSVNHKDIKEWKGKNYFEMTVSQAINSDPNIGFLRTACKNWRELRSQIIQIAPFYHENFIPPYKEVTQSSINNWLSSKILDRFYEKRVGTEYILDDIYPEDDDDLLRAGFRVLIVNYNNEYDIGYSMSQRYFYNLWDGDVIGSTKDHLIDYLWEFHEADEDSNEDTFNTNLKLLGLK